MITSKTCSKGRSARMLVPASRQVHGLSCQDISQVEHSARPEDIIYFLAMSSAEVGLPLAYKVSQGGRTSDACNAHAATPSKQGASCHMAITS